MKHQQVMCDAPWHYEVIGEHVRDRHRLLVIADDGKFYALDVTDCHIEPTTLDGEWLTVPVKLPGDIRPLNLNYPKTTKAS